MPSKCDSSDCITKHKDCIWNIFKNMPPDKPGLIEHLDNSLKESNISFIQECQLIGDFNVDLLSGYKMLLEKQHYDSYSQAPPLV